MGMTGRIVQPADARHTSFADGDGLRVVIPSRRQWFMMIFLGIWLIGWAFGEIAALSILLGTMFSSFVNFEFSVETFAGVNSFLLLWLTGWTVGGAFALFLILWQLAGREVVQVNQSVISLRKEILSIGRAKQYSREHLQDLRVSPHIPGAFGWGRGLSHYGLVGGFLAFDYGAKTIHFGAGVDEAEAKQIYQKIIEHYPQYAGTQG